jgi:hypothetical protein
VSPIFVNLIAANATPTVQAATIHKRATNFLEEKRIEFLILETFLTPLCMVDELSILN